MTGPPLSVVIGTTEGWPYARTVLESVSPQVAAVGGELIIADGSGRPAPPGSEIDSTTRWMSVAQPSVFKLYAIGLREASGDIVATTEDHCTVRPGWCAAILRAHTEHPKAAAIGGAIENGSRLSLLDWASYFITQGPHMAPLGRRQVATTTNEADVSYKRWAIEGFADHGGLGFMAILHNRQLAEAGHELRVDDRMVVDHHQQLGFGPTSSIHFHNGRTIAGFRRRDGMGGEEWIRLAASLLIPLWRTGRALRVGWRKGRLRVTLLASMPWALWLEFCQGVGHLVGYAVGPGDSPSHLR